MISYDDIKIAEKDIFCYELFNVQDIFAEKTPLVLPYEKHIMCPIKNHIWYIGEENEVLQEESRTPYGRYYHVNGIRKEYDDGWFLTWGDKNYAKFRLSKVDYFFEHKTVVLCKCVIPAGSKYVKGYFWDCYSTQDAYASNKLYVYEILR